MEEILFFVKISIPALEKEATIQYTPQVMLITVGRRLPLHLCHVSLLSWRFLLLTIILQNAQTSEIMHDFGRICILKGDVYFPILLREVASGPLPVEDCIVPV